MEYSIEEIRPSNTKFNIIEDTKTENGYLATVKSSIHAAIELKERLLDDEVVHSISQAGKTLLNAFKEGNKVFFCGNGGSAADAQHLAAEFLIRYKANSNRPPLPGIALTTDSSALTAGGNDLGFDNIFAQQIKAVGSKGDCVVLISTSGKSTNLINAAYAAKEKGMTVIGLLGWRGGDLAGICDYTVIIPSFTTARIQECHIMVGHIWCEMVENYYNNTEIIFSSAKPSFNKVTVTNQDTFSNGVEQRKPPGQIFNELQIEAFHRNSKLSSDIEKVKI